MYKALQFYALFLKEFPQLPVEENPRIKFALEEDNVVILVLQLPKFNPSSTTHSSFIYRRTVDWFNMRGNLNIERSAIGYSRVRKAIMLGMTGWSFCICRTGAEGKRLWGFQYV